MASERDPYAVDSILRACEVLRAFQMDDEELRLRNVVERTGLHKATAYRTLRSLLAGGLIERIGSARYRSHAPSSTRHHPRAIIQDKSRVR